MTDYRRSLPSAPDPDGWTPDQRFETRYRLALFREFLRRRLLGLPPYQS